MSRSFFYAFIVAGIPALYFCGAALKGNLFLEPLPFSGWREAMLAVGFMLVLGPMEEFGVERDEPPLQQRQRSLRVPDKQGKSRCCLHGGGGGADR